MWWHTAWFSWTGADNVSGTAYGLWSGFLSVAIPPLLTVLGMTLVAWWHNQCHTRWCFRWARFQDHSEPPHVWRKCRKHHPLDNARNGQEEART